MLNSVRDLAQRIAARVPDLPRVYGAKDKTGRLCVRFSVGALRRDLTPDQARRIAGELLAHADLADDRQAAADEILAAVRKVVEQTRAEGAPEADRPTGRVPPQGAGPRRSQAGGGPRQALEGDQ